MTTGPRRPGPESTLGEVREKLIAAGTELLRNRGVDLGLSEITLSDTIAEAGVTRSTAYRSLADDELAPQAVLHRELLTYVLARYTRTDNRSAIETAVGAELRRNALVMAAGSVEERSRVMRSTIRIGANTSYAGVAQATDRSILTALYGSLRSSAARPDWRHEALTEGERGLNTMFSELYEALAVLFDYRIKPPYSMRHFTAAGASLIEGMAMRDGFNDAVATIERATGPGGSPEEWTLFAIAFEAMFVGMFEPANRADPFADLLKY